MRTTKLRGMQVYLMNSWVKLNLLLRHGANPGAIEQSVKAVDEQGRALDEVNIATRERRDVRGTKNSTDISKSEEVAALPKNYLLTLKN